MTYEEMRKRMTDAVTKPDTMAAEVATLLEDIRTDYEERETARRSLEEAEKRIRDLQDTNQRLFLSITKEADEEEDEKEPLTGEEAVTEFWKKLEEEE